MPKADKDDKKKWRICDKCSSKFYLRDVYAKHKAEWDAKQVTLRGFQEAIDRNEEEMKKKAAELSRRHEGYRIQKEQFETSLRVQEQKQKECEKENEQLRKKLGRYTEKDQAQTTRFQELSREKNELEATINELYLLLI
jgi:chromosome segregation ATPase